MHSKGSVVAAVVGLTVAGLVLVGLGGPASATPTATGRADADDASTGPGRIGPGTRMVTAGRACTASFVFRDAAGRTYLGYAATCASRRPAVAGNACTARALPRGTEVRLVDRGRTLGTGRLAYSSLRAMRRAGITDPATCAANDFALVRLGGAARRQVRASVAYWGGPGGIGELPAAGSTVFGLLRPSARSRTLPRVGQVTAATTSVASVATPLPGNAAARGSGFQDQSGRAVGILTRSSATGASTVIGLAGAVAFAQGHGVPGLRVVQGRHPFAATAVL